MAVSPKMISDAVTDTVRKDVQSIAEKLVKFEERSDKAKLLKLLTLEIHYDTKTFLSLAIQREHEHIMFVNYILYGLPDFETAQRQPHDFSKDTLFFFVASSYFTANVQSEEMKHLLDKELKRHYTLEAHHPEFEIHNEKECSDNDIMEMAIDRLSRNAQFGDSHIDLDVMKKYMPTFPRGDNEKKRKLFWIFVMKYKDLVQEKFHLLFPESLMWC